MDRYMDCSGDCLDCLGDRSVYVPGCGEIELCVLIQAMATGIYTLLRELEDDHRSWAPCDKEATLWRIAGSYRATP